MCLPNTFIQLIIGNRVSGMNVVGVVSGDLGQVKNKNKDSVTSAVCLASKFHGIVSCASVSTSIEWKRLVAISQGFPV